MSNVPIDELSRRLKHYEWYHRIKVREGLYTEPKPNYYFPKVWDFIFKNLYDVDFQEKKVLDVGCRDCLFSFEAEKRGASEVIAIDNDLSRGASELLIPLFQSKIKLEQLNLYELSPKQFGSFDIILFFGVLYHLRYPFWALKKLIDCLSDGGFLFIESGMLVSKPLAEFEILYCPVEKSPYEPTSCCFFNQEALVTTLRSLDCRLIHQDTAHSKSNGVGTKKWLRFTLKTLLAKLVTSVNPENSILFAGDLMNVQRQFYVFQKIFI